MWRSQERVLDGTRPMATITFNGAPATRLSGAGPVDDVIGRTVDLALAVLSAEQVGACERVLEIATDYARTREQFNRPIGSFQAIKHKCADMLVDLEWARSASQAALEAVDGDMAGESGWRASMAKAVCSEALRERGARQRADPRRHRIHLGRLGASVPAAGPHRRGVVR